MHINYFGRYFSSEFYQNIKQKIIWFFEDNSPLYNRNSLIRQIKKENLENNNLEKRVD
jgi:hypothetical protein